jgi:hypothetical protein
MSDGVGAGLRDWMALNALKCPKTAPKPLRLNKCDKSIPVGVTGLLWAFSWQWVIEQWFWPACHRGCKYQAGSSVFHPCSPRR